MPKKILTNEEGCLAHKHLQFNLSNKYERIAYEFLGLLPRRNVAFISELVLRFLSVNGIEDVNALNTADAKELLRNIDYCFSATPNTDKKHAQRISELEDTIYKLELKLQEQASLQKMVDTLMATNQQLMTVLQMQSSSMQVVAPVVNTIHEVSALSSTQTKENTPEPAVMHPLPNVKDENIRFKADENQSTQFSPVISIEDSDDEPDDDFIDDELLSGMSDLF